TPDADGLSATQPRRAHPATAASSTQTGCLTLHLASTRAAKLHSRSIESVIPADPAIHPWQTLRRALIAPERTHPPTNHPRLYDVALTRRRDLRDSAATG